MCDENTKTTNSKKSYSTKKILLSPIIYFAIWSQVTKI